VTITEATKLYAAINHFGVQFQDSYSMVTISIKICIFTCSVVPVYNALMFNLPPVEYLLMPVTFSASLVIFVYVVIPLSDLNTASLACILKQRGKALGVPLERISWNSFRPIRMTIGPFYKLDRSIVLTYFDFVLIHVINILLLFPKE